MVRAEIIELLRFPRALVRDSVPVENCVHQGYFSIEDAHSETCAQRFECLWLYHNDEFSGFAKKSTQQMLAGLDYAADLVDAHVARRGHSHRTCDCSACVWLRNARNFYRDESAGKIINKEPE